MPSPLSTIERTSSHTDSEGARGKNAANHEDLTDTYRTVLPATAECTLLSSMHGLSTKIKLTRGHKTSLNKS